MQRISLTLALSLLALHSWAASNTTRKPLAKSIEMVSSKSFQIPSTLSREKCPSFSTEIALDLAPDGSISHASFPVQPDCSSKVLDSILQQIEAGTRFNADDSVAVRKVRVPLTHQEAPERPEEVPVWVTEPPTMKIAADVFENPEIWSCEIAHAALDIEPSGLIRDVRFLAHQGCSPFILNWTAQNLKEGRFNASATPTRTYNISIPKRTKQVRQPWERD